MGFEESKHYVPGPTAAQVLPRAMWMGLWLMSLFLPGQSRVGSSYHPVGIYGSLDATSAGPRHIQQGLPKVAPGPLNLLPLELEPRAWACWVSAHSATESGEAWTLPQRVTLSTGQALCLWQQSSQVQGTMAYTICYPGGWGAKEPCGSGGAEDPARWLQGSALGD